MLHPSMIRHARQAGSVTLSLALALALAGCAAEPENRLLDSINQPVVEHSEYQIDLASGPGGLGAEDRGRLDGWFSALNLHYGDQISIDDPLASPATHDTVKHLAAHYGLLVNNTAPVTQGYVNAGTVRVIVTRTTASVPNCPNLKSIAEGNYANSTTANYGCAVNGNMAVMVANPNDLLSGAHGPALSSVETGDKAIFQQQQQKPAGTSAVAPTSTK